MKRFFGPAWLLCGLTLVLLPFTVLLRTSASERASGSPKDGTRTLVSAHAAPALSLTVVTPSDDGAGSLRDAINVANANPGPDLITFSGGITSIAVGSTTGLPLPDITEEVTIDGFANRVELNGTSAGGGANGLTITAPNVTIRSLVINRFSGDGISIQADNCIIQNNLIGTDAVGTAGLPNGGTGIRIAGSNNQIGGTSAADRNVISANSSSGIELTGAPSNNNTIQGNFIGVDAGGTNPLGNGSSGIRGLGGSDNNLIGGTGAGAPNTIKFNAGAGVRLFGGSNNGILGNSIFGNTALGINISDDPGITANDSCDADSGANGLQNFPALTSAVSGGGITTIMGSLDSTPNTNFRVEFFSSSTCDTSGNGQGETFIGAATVTTPAGCVASINVNLPVSVPVGNVITATATDPLNNTSEFSGCVSVGALAASDLQVSNADSPDPVLSGSNITYAISVLNNGPDPDNMVTFTDSIPTGTTFVSLTSPGSCSTPPVGGTGTVSCNLGLLNAGASAAITLVVNVNAAPGSTIMNIATISGVSGDPNLANNSATASTGVFSPFCVLTCPPDLFASTSSGTCGAVVTFAPTSSSCGPITCSPPSGSVFPVGSNSVTCSAAGGPSCSFNILVVDGVAPSLSCPAGFSTPLPAGRTSAVVNYPAPTASDECGTVTVSCVPPSGSTFPPGATLVTCTALDGFENANRCFFFVSVLDPEPPVIRCPADVSVSPPAGQTSAVVSYPAPTVTDNLPGVIVACTPASGSSFSQGTTVVTCTATDSGGNKASCSFNVGVGSAQAAVIIPGNKTTVDFVATPSRKVPKPKNNPCSLFTIQNVGFAPLTLTLDSIVRTGTAVDSGRITDPNDTRYFSLSLVNADQSIIPLDIGGVITIQPRQSRNFCVKFAALIPALAGKTTNLSASNVLPDTLTSRIVFRQTSGANIVVPLSARVSTAVSLVNLANPKALPEVLFTKSGDDISVTYGIFDSNLDVTRAKYEFLNAGGQVIAGPFEIDLAGSISSANLLKGQSFSVEQRFTGASGNADVTGVRVTVFDGESNAVSSSALSSSSVNGATIELMNRGSRVTLYPPTIGLRW